MNNLTDLIITEVKSISSIYTQKDMRNKRVSRERWALVLKYEGETEYFVNGKKHLSNIENMVILPKGVSYEWHCKKSGRFYIIEFESGMTKEEIYSFPIRNGEKILSEFKEIEYKMNLNNNVSKMECITGTYMIILQLLKGTSKGYLPSEKYSKISPAIDFIAQNYNQSIKNDDLAKLCNLSTVYFRKLFVTLTGTSPIVYIHEMRISKAKEMLKSDYSSITDIALSLGYENIYDFSRVFKKITGIPPSKY